MYANFNLSEMPVEGAGVLTNLTPIMETSMYRTVVILRDIGFFDFIVPFLLVFTVFYALFSSTKIFGESPALSTVISLLIALLFLWATTYIRVGLLLTDLITKTSIILIIIFLGLLIAGMLGLKWRE